MKAIKTLLLASAFVAGGVFAAAAQSGTSPGSARTGATGDVSAATHCKDSSGKIQLKSAMSGSGSGAAGSTSGSGTMSGGTTSGSTGGMAGSKSGTGSGMGASGSSAAAANLPSC